MCIFSSSLFFLCLKVICKGTTDLVCVMLNTPPPFFLFATKRRIDSLYLMFSPLFNVNIFVLYFWKATSTECVQNHMCLTCKSTLWQSQIIQVFAKWQTLSAFISNMQDIFYCLLFFFHLRFIFSQNILHETYIQKHKRPIFF